MIEKYTEASIQESLKWFISNPKYRIENLYVFPWESDLLFLTPAGYWYEIEVKISRADFFNDAKKTVGLSSKAEFISNPDRHAPNYFYYAAPERLISLEEVPSHAGLIEVDGRKWKVVKPAPKLRGKIEVSQALLVDKFYHNWRNEISNHRKTKKDIKKVEARYSDVERTIKYESARLVNNEKYRAIEAYRRACPYYDIASWSCVKEGPNPRRCGWCEGYKKFDKLIYKEK